VKIFVKRIGLISCLQNRLLTVRPKRIVLLFQVANVSLLALFKGKKERPRA
jgi:hypothetical protein